MSPDVHFTPGDTSQSDSLAAAAIIALGAIATMDVVGQSTLADSARADERDSTKPPVGVQFGTTFEMHLRSCCLLRTGLRLVLQVLAFFGVMLPHGALADGAQGQLSGPGPSPCAPPSPHRVQLAAGAHYMLAARNDYGESLKITPSLQAAYLYRAFRYLELGGGLSVYVWTERKGGPIFLPHVAARAFVPFASDGEAIELGFSVRIGAAIGYYHTDLYGEPDHAPIHTGFGLALGPDVRIPLYRSTSLHFSLELSRFGEEKLSRDYYAPLASLGIGFGIVTAL